jgi:hypothetical protein
MEALRPAREGYGLRTRPTKLSACPRSTTDINERSFTLSDRKPRSGGQGVASSNLASPTEHQSTIASNQRLVHSAAGPFSTSCSVGELCPNWTSRARICGTDAQHRLLVRVQVPGRNCRVLMAG